MVPVLYGGSVEATNAAAIANLASVDGLFVGRAALDPNVFVRIASIDIERTHSMLQEVVSARATRAESDPLCEALVVALDH